MTDVYVISFVSISIGLTKILTCWWRYMENDRINYYKFIHECLYQMSRQSIQQRENQGTTKVREP